MSVYLKKKYFSLIPESPTWLISKNRYEEAYKQLVRVCKFNGKKVPTELMEDIKVMNNQFEVIFQFKILIVFLISVIENG